MAPRKKSSSKQPNVGAWLGGNKGYVLSGSNTDTSAKADAGGGQAEAVRGELGLGAYTAGIGATAAIGAGVAAVRSGVVARGVNKITKQQVIVHGGKVRGLQQIDPRAPYSGTDAAVFGVNPSFRLPAKTNPVSEPSRPLDFAKIAHGYATELKDSGSIYVAKVPKTSVKNRGSLGSKPSESIVISSAPAKVVAEIPVIPDERILLARRAEVIKAVKRAGAKVPKKK